MIWETENFSASILIQQFWYRALTQDLCLVARLRTLTFHQGFVKGLAFDPAGELLASQVGRSRDDIFKVSSDVYLICNSPMISRYAYGKRQTGH